MKTCKGCTLAQPLENFSRSAEAKDGRQGRCKACDRQRYLNNAEVVKARSRKYAQENREAISTRAAEYRAKNAEKIAQTKRQYYAKNKGKLREYYARWFSTNVENVKVQRRGYYAANQAEIRKRAAEYSILNAGKIKDRRQRWRELNPERALDAGRKGLKTRLKRIREGGPIDEALLLWRFAEIFNNRCFYCGGEGPPSVDHSIPLSRGGSNQLANLRPACRKCNWAKGKKTHREFLAWLELKRSLLSGRD